MSTKEPESNPVTDRPASIDSAQAWAGVTALAAHFSRAGIDWLPNPDRAASAELAARWITTPDPARSSSGRSEPNPDQPATSPRDPASSVRAKSDPGVSSAGTRTTPPRPAALIDTEFAAAEPYAGPALPVAARQQTLDDLAQTVATCTRCEVLTACRKQTVFGEGSATPRVVFFGEGPGADEDRTGRPFVGRAGQLLTKMIEACTFRREDVYILNTVKCRPPGNRNPEPQEVENCREYFQQQLAILRPQYIVCLGAVSCQALLKYKLSVGQLRGRIHRYFDSKVIVTYHPAYLLRNPAAKKAAWEDLQLMLRDAGIRP